MLASVLLAGVRECFSWQRGKLILPELQTLGRGGTSVLEILFVLRLGLLVPGSLANTRQVFSKAVLWIVEHRSFGCKNILPGGALFVRFLLEK